MNGFPLYINVISSYSFEIELTWTGQISKVTILEITQDALCVVGAQVELHFNMFY